jgi:hypothetical protein
MLDDLDDGSRVKAFQTLVAIHQRSLYQLNPCPLLLTDLLQFQPLRGNLNRTPGNIHAQDLLELMVGQERTQEFAFSATQVQHALGANSTKSRENCTHALLI